MRPAGAPRPASRPTIGAMSSNGTAKTSWSTNARRSAGCSVSSTTSSAAPTASAAIVRLSESGSALSARVMTGSGSRPASSASSRRRLRASSIVRHTRDTTVVSQPGMLSTSLLSARSTRIHASCSALNIATGRWSANRAGEVLILPVVIRCGRSHQAPPGYIRWSKRASAPKRQRGVSWSGGSATCTRPLFGSQIDSRARSSWRGAESTSVRCMAHGDGSRHTRATRAPRLRQYVTHDVGGLG